MWEEHPAYQKAQAKMIGIMIAAVFIGAIVYSVVKQDWDLLKFVLLAGLGSLTALAILPLTAWLIVKAVRRRGARASKPRQEQ